MCLSQACFVTEDFANMEKADKEAKSSADTGLKKSEVSPAGGDFTGTPAYGRSGTKDSKKSEVSAASGDFEESPGSGKSGTMDFKMPQVSGAAFKKIPTGKRLDSFTAYRDVKMTPTSGKSGTVDFKKPRGIPESKDFEEGNPSFMSAGITFQPVGTAANKEPVSYSPEAFKMPMGVSPRRDPTKPPSTPKPIFRQPMQAPSSLEECVLLYGAGKFSTPGKPGSATFQKPVGTPPRQDTPIPTIFGKWASPTAPGGSPLRQDSYKTPTPGTSGYVTPKRPWEAISQEETSTPRASGYSGSTTSQDDSVEISDSDLGEASTSGTPVASGSRLETMSPYAKKKAYANLSRASSTEKPPLKNTKQERTTPTTTHL